MTIYKSAILFGQKFTLQKSRVVSTIDYFISAKDESDEEIGSIKYFFIYKSTVYALVEIFDIIASCDQFKEVKSSELSKIMHLSEIKHKLLHVNIAKNIIAVKIANKYEKT